MIICLVLWHVITQLCPNFNAYYTINSAVVLVREWMNNYITRKLFVRLLCLWLSYFHTNHVSKWRPFALLSTYLCLPGCIFADIEVHKQNIWFADSQSSPSTGAGQIHAQCSGWRSGFENICYRLFTKIKMDFMYFPIFYTLHITTMY